MGLSRWSERALGRRDAGDQGVEGAGLAQGAGERLEGGLDEALAHFFGGHGEERRRGVVHADPEATAGRVAGAVRDADVERRGGRVGEPDDSNVGPEFYEPRGENPLKPPRS